MQPCRKCCFELMYLRERYNPWENKTGKKQKLPAELDYTTRKWKKMFLDDPLNPKQKEKNRPCWNTQPDRKSGQVLAYIQYFLGLLVTSLWQVLLGFKGSQDKQVANQCSKGNIIFIPLIHLMVAPDGQHKINTTSWAKQTTVFNIISSYLHLLGYKMWNATRIRVNTSLSHVLKMHFFSWHTDLCDFNSLTCFLLILVQVTSVSGLWVLCSI